MIRTSAAMQASAQLAALTQHANTTLTTSRKSDAANTGQTSFLEHLQKLSASVEAKESHRMSANETNPQTLEDSWKTTLMKWQHQPGSQMSYHVMEIPPISDANWQHNDFPYDQLFKKEINPSVFSWTPSRANPSPLDSSIQAKINSTLGKNSIIIPPKLEEKIKNDPAMAEKVMNNIESLCESHYQGYSTQIAPPGTKFYGTTIHSSVIILNEDGEVDHARFSGGGRFLGPDEHTLRQVEQEQEKKQARREETRRMMKLSEQEYIANHISQMREMQLLMPQTDVLQSVTF